MEETGNAAGKPVVFLHGGMGNPEDFNLLIPQLDQAFRYIFIDSRGQGKSLLGNEPLTYELISEDIVAIIQKMQLEDPILLGFSDGGTIALRLALNQENKISKLILLGTTWHSKYLKKIGPILKKVTPESWREKFPEMIETYQKLNPEPDFDQLIKAILPMWLDETNTGHPDDSVKTIHCPVMVLRGDDDHLVDQETTIELVAVLTDAHFANIPFADHEVHKDQHQIVAILINQFINDNFKATEIN